MKTLIACLFGVLSTLALSGCVTNEATGEQQFMMLSRQDEIEIGEAGKAEMLKEMGGEVKNAALRQYVDRIGKSMARMTEGTNPTLPWEFILVDSDMINAFAMPGGKVFVTRGLAAKMTNEAQLAAVLGHEIGHVTARHINDRVTRMTGTAVLVEILAGVAGDDADSVRELGMQVATVALMPYDRNQESQSDSLGLRYMTRLNYNPVGMVQLMEILEQSMQGAHPPEWLSTHPLPRTRIQRVGSEINSVYSQTQNNPAFKTGEAEFKSQFLQKLSFEPPAAHRPASSRYAAAGWCLHCAHSH